MAGWKERADARLDEIYARVPVMRGCDGRCWRSCGPIEMSPRERARIREAGIRITPAPEAVAALPDFECDALDEDRRCLVYDRRPLICLLPGAWVYAKDGPKRIEDIYAGEQVYGNDGLLHEVAATASRVHDGPVVDIRHSGTHVSCWSTDDHLWLVARQKDKRKTPAPDWRRAGSLEAKRHHQAGDYLCFPRRFEDPPPLAYLDPLAYVGWLAGETLLPFTHGGKPVRGIVQAIPARIPVDDEFLYMLGIYLAEGSSSYQSVSFTMHPGEAPILKRIGVYLDDLCITSHVLRVGRAAVLTVSSALLGRLMKALAGDGAAGKRINPLLFGQLSHAQLWSVYLAWDIGDGRKCLREQEMSTTTISEHLAVQMGFVALANGLFPRTYLGKPGNRNAPAYDVHLFPSNWRDAKPGYGTKNMADDDYLYTPVAGDQYRRGPNAPERYCGPVFDLQVEGADSFVTSSGIAHNCRLWGAVEDMRCPFGCQPEGGYLTHAEAAALIRESLIAGGDEPAPAPVLPAGLRRAVSGS